jgi:hypothetical protein
MKNTIKDNLGLIVCTLFFACTAVLNINWTVMVQQNKFGINPAYAGELAKYGWH